MTDSQPDFAGALLDAGRPVPAGLHDGRHRPAGRRFDVYRNNVAASLTQALHAGFPVIARLLGKENMDGLAGIYLRRHPPSSPRMMFFGEAFPDFLASMPQLAHLGYLADVARLELALRRAYHAADASPLAAEALNAVPPDRLVRTALGLAPAAQVIRSPWPVHDIWRMNTEPGAPPPRAVAQDLCIMRPGFDPAPWLLPPGGAGFVECLMAGAPLGEAAAAGQRADPDFDLTPVLTLLLQGEAIISLSQKD